MSCDQALDKRSEKLNSRLLVQEEHGFQKGAQCAPLAAGAQKKPGLDRVKRSILGFGIGPEGQEISYFIFFQGPQNFHQLTWECTFLILSVVSLYKSYQGRTF